MSKSKRTLDPLFPRDYWTVPKAENLATKGDNDPDKLATAVGYALSNWERADQEMADVFIVMTGCETAEVERTPENTNHIVGAMIANSATRRAYGTIHSSTARRGAIRAAAETYFGSSWDDPDIYAAFTDIYSAVGDASKLRDNIAHGVIWPNITINDINYGSFLMPAEYKSDRTYPFVNEEDNPLGFTRAKYRYTSATIGGIGRKFLVLRDAIQNYANLISRRGAKIPLVEHILSERRDKKS